jgi:SagB-type dehydrogenase family enzyme
MEDKGEVTFRVSSFLCVRLENEKFYIGSDIVGRVRQVPTGLLNLIRGWTSVSYDDLLLTLNQHGVPKQRAMAALDCLVEAGILIECDGALDLKERALQCCPWGRSTISHLLATRRVSWMDRSRELEALGELLRNVPAPPLWRDIDGTAWQPLAVTLQARSVFELMAHRRSVRQFSSQPIDAADLGAILSAGIGIHDFLHLPYRPVFPLRFTPSPGALNCYEAFIFCANVNSLNDGVYLFDPILNNVRAEAVLPRSKMTGIFGNQSWMEEASAVIVLCADYKKMAWKYRDASAFNSLLLEAGHIAQNISLCAASLGLGSVCTNAIDQEQIEQILGIPAGCRAFTYAIAVGYQDLSRPIDYYSSEALARLEMIFGDDLDKDKINDVI